MLPTSPVRTNTPAPLLLLLPGLLLWLILTPALLCAEHVPMLPKVHEGQNVSDWLMSEKFDGVRGYWDGRQLRSKTGNPFQPPLAFTAGLPPFPLEGELWAGRGGFERTVSTVKKEGPHDGWLQLKFAIFDVPDAPGGFSERIKLARRWFAEYPSEYAFVIEQRPIRSHQHLRQELERVEVLGGEGLIVRDPTAPYQAGRSATILKVKSFEDAEARVVEHLPGEGRNAGRLGALLVEGDDGARFRIGTGFSDAERESPPPIGAIVTFKFYGRYASGVPKFPSFLRVRSERGFSSIQTPAPNR